MNHCELHPVFEIRVLHVQVFHCFSCSFPHSFRRVHITEATLKHLNKAYEVEEGEGHLRDPYLKELSVRTYLVIDPRVSSSPVFLENYVVDSEKYLAFENT